VRRLVLIVALAALGACGHGSQPPLRVPTAPGRTPAAPPGPDRALDLLSRLPAGADRCVMVRPARVPAARRGLLARVSQAEPLAWIAGLGIEAYVSAQLERRTGPSGQVTLLWMRAKGTARIRALLAAHSGLGLHWEDDAPACSPLECPLRARSLGDHVVQIERGPFVPNARAGVEQQCARMAERSRTAVELSVARSRAFGSFSFSGLPVRASSELHASATGIHVSRVDRMRDPIEAERALGEGPTADLLLPRSGSLGSNLRRVRDGASIRTELDLLWEDLELARDDEARLQAAPRAAEALLSEPPAADVGAPARREDVLAELGYRLELMQRAAGEPRKAEAQAARVLLERALQRDPEDEGLALLLAELLLSEHAEAAPARALVQRFAARPGANRGWPAIARHVAALTGVDALAHALVEHGMLDRRRARVVAHEIVAQMRDGTSYDRAERAALERPE
jgi:hypothetical protein